MSARIGVIGCGWWSTRAHLPALSANPDATIAGIADPDEDKRQRTAEHFDVPPERAFADAREMLESTDLDGVIVAVPHALHAEVTERVLERGLHTLLEKPMTLRSEDARHLYDLAATRGVELIIGYPWHYNAHVVALRDAIAAGRIGRIEAIACHYAAMARELFRGTPERYGDALGFPVHAPGSATYSDPDVAGGGQGVTQTTHAVALMLWLTGLQPREVAAMTERFDLDVDLVDGVVLRFDGGAIGTIASTGSLPPGQDEHMEMRIYGTRGHVVLDLTAGRSTIMEAAGSTEELEPLPPEQRSPEWAPVQNLIDVILDRDVNRSPSSIGMRTVEVIEGMYRAHAERRSISLPRPTPTP